MGVRFHAVIYFDDAAKRRVVDSFYDALRPGGVLMLGPAESLYAVSRAFQARAFQGTIAYVKE